MSEADIHIYNCIILTMKSEEVIHDGAITIKNGRIAFIGKAKSAYKTEAKVEIDAREKVALPGLVNCHTHLPMTIFRGIAEDKKLGEWLKETIWPLEVKLKPHDVYAGALLGCLEMIKSGTTCFADMYFYEDMVARAVAESGLRGVLAEGIIEAGDKAAGGKMFDRSVDFASSFNGYADGRVSTMLGPHAVYSCSSDLLAKAKEKAVELGVGVHIHLGESKELFEKPGKKSEVEFLDKIGFFDARVLAAHCTNLSQRDMNLLAKRGVNVVYVPVSNMKLGSGAAKICEMTGLGVNICLGTDGAASSNSLDMFETMKFAALLQKLIYSDPAVLSAFDVLKMATVNGAKALGLGDSMGTLEAGRRADLILVDFSKPHLKPLHNVFANLVYSVRGNDVDTVIVDGRILMHNKEVKVLDEKAVIEKAEKAIHELLAR